MISSTRHRRIRQNISIVCVLTLSLRLSRVICPGLTPYRFISAYCEASLTFKTFYRFRHDIITFKLCLTKHFPYKAFIR